MTENPYQSPEQLPALKRRGAGFLRMMFSGLVVGTLVGLGAGAVAGGALFVALWVLASWQTPVNDPLIAAELGAMQTFRGVFTGAMLGFVLLAPLGVLLGAAVSLWQPADKRPFLILSTVLCVILFASVGVCVPQWPAPISALVTGAVGIGGGMMLGRVLAEMAWQERARAEARRR